MYSCEKLARGRSSKFTKHEPHKIESYIQPVVKEPIKRHAFSHIEEYSVSIEEYQDRPRGIMQSQDSAMQGPSLVKTRFGRRK